MRELARHLHADERRLLLDGREEGEKGCVLPYIHGHGRGEEGVVAFSIFHFVESIGVTRGRKGIRKGSSVIPIWN